LRLELAASGATMPGSSSPGVMKAKLVRVRVRVRVRVTVGLGLGVRVRARARVRPDVIECKPLPARAALKQQGQRDRPQPG
jgi:hypothetical protein